MVMTFFGAIMITFDLISNDAYFIGMSIIIGFAYLGSVINNNKIQATPNQLKQLLTESSGSPIGLDKSFDKINDLIKQAGPLVDIINKNNQQSKHYRNRKNNNKQILN